MKPSTALLMSESARPRYDNPPHIDRDTIALGDVQIPFHDQKFINNCKRVAFAWGIGHCSLGGDVFDLHALAKWVSLDETDLAAELDEDEQYFKELVSGFDEVDMIRGNHDARIAVVLNHYLPTARLAKMLGAPDMVHSSDYFWMEVGDEWLIEHPVNSSVIPGRVAMWLAEKYRKNVLTFHGHTSGSAQTRDGGLIGIDAGICCDPMRLAYTQIRHNTRPAMTQGAVMLVKGLDNRFHPHIINQHTDFDAMVEMGEAWQSQKQKQNQNDFAHQVSLAHSRLEAMQTVKP